VARASRRNQLTTATGQLRDGAQQPKANSAYLLWQVVGADRMAGPAQGQDIALMSIDDLLSDLIFSRNCGQVTAAACIASRCNYLLEK
jgi:hypothetical protein